MRTVEISRSPDRFPGAEAQLADLLPTRIYNKNHPSPRSLRHDPVSRNVRVASLRPLKHYTYTYTFRVPHIVTTILVALTPSFNSSNAFCTSPSPLPTTFGFGLQRKRPFSSAFSRNSYTVGPYSAF